MHKFFHKLPRDQGLLGSTAEDWKEQAVMKYMPALFECGLSTLDEAVQCKSGRLIMRPASSLRLLSGARLPKRQKIVHKQMTILLNQGTVSHSLATNNLPEASRIVNDFQLLGGLCCRNLPEPGVDEVEEGEDGQSSATAVSDLPASLKVTRTLQQLYKAACRNAKARSKRRELVALKGSITKEKRRKLCPEPDCTSPEAYAEWLRHNSESQEHILALYDGDMRLAAVRDERDSDQGLQYLVSFAPITMRRAHALVLNKFGHLASMKALPKAQAPDPVAAWCTVTWHDTWEDGESIHQNQDINVIFRRYMLVRRDRLVKLRKDGSLTPTVQQGHISQDLRPVHSRMTHPDLLSLRRIDPLTTRDPDSDIVGTGGFSISRTPHSETYAVHTPAGHTIGRLPRQRLDLLHAAFQANRMEETPSFEGAVASLLLKKNVASLAPPAPILNALRSGLHLESEIFASSLTFNPQMDCCYSEVAQDRRFGSNASAFSTAWSGSNLAVPPEDDKAMKTALGWAISSASTLTCRCLTVLILRARRHTANRQYLQHPLVHVLFDIPAAALVPLHTTARPANRAGKLVVLVANEAALCNTDRSRLQDELARACTGLETSAELGMPVPDLQHLRNIKSHQCSEAHECSCKSFYAPKAFNQLKTLGGTPKQWRNGTELVRPYTNLSQTPLAWIDAGSIIYRDGSVATDGASHTVEAGDCRPADGLELRVDPARFGATNTINGAELAAIMVALDGIVAPGGRAIATDSKTSLHLIHRQLHEPPQIFVRLVRTTGSYIGKKLHVRP